ncbi:MAG: hypothetical protein KY458_04650 [Actinobacteria bacterium]|nr:hypothetical protein [Actinomycetota bacterium]
MSNTITIRRTLTLTLGVALGVISLSTSAFAAPSEKSQAGGHDPSGNNGTIKIDGEDFDDAPDNEPHVGCTFQIDFYGFDRDPAVDNVANRSYFSKVTFEGIAPTGGGNLVPDTGSTSVFVGEDAAGGGTDLDASETYDFTRTLSALVPHPKQGYHVKVTVHTPFSRGADVKHKVLWIAPCTTAVQEEQVMEEVKEQPKQETRSETKKEAVQEILSRVEQVQPAAVVVPEVAAQAVAGETASMVLSAAAEAAPPAAPVAADRAMVLGVEYTRGAAAEQLAVTGESPRTFVLLAGIALCLGLAFISGSKLLAQA